MKTNRCFVAAFLLLAILLGPGLDPCPAAQGKDLLPHSELRAASKLMEVPDLERDPGMFFLLAEQADAVGETDGVLFYIRKALELDPSSAYLNTRVASILARSRKIADAMTMAIKATLFDPEYEEAYTLLGRIYTVTGDRHKAIQTYNRALELRPDEKDLYIFIGSLQGSQKLYADAEKTFQKMIAKFPDEKEGYFYLGKVYIEDKRYDQALEVFKTLVDRRPDGLGPVYVEIGGIYMLQKKYPEAEEHFREAVKRDPFSISARLNLGQVLALQKKHEESLEVFQELSKLAPSNLGIQIKMALIMSEQKQFDKAKEILDQILHAKPGWDQVRFQLGRVLREQGKLEEAEKEFLQINKGQPMFLNSRIMLALMYLRSRELNKAIRYINDAIEAESKDADLYHIKGSILEELNRFQEASEAYQAALEQDPRNVRMRYSLGNVREKAGRRSDGLRDMEKVVAEKPDDAAALNFIGYTMALAGQEVEKAEQNIRKALELKPDDGYILDSMGWFLFLRGKTEEAMPYLEKATEKVKHDPIIVDHFGDALLASGKKSEALEAYRKSLQFNPDNLLVQEKLQKLEQELGSRPNK
jgi:tetratricopeptide (TPR) repeat protein